MDQSERLAQVQTAQKTIAAADKELSQLYKVRTAGEKVLDNADTEADTRDKAVVEMAALLRRIAAVGDRRHQAKRWIEKMQSESADAGLVRVISSHDKRAQIVIHYAESNGKKLSYTRHVHWDGKEWMGLSTVGWGHQAYHITANQIAQAA